MSTNPQFRNLIRFLDESRVERYGDVGDSSLDSIIGSEVELLHDIDDLARTGKKAVVHEVRYIRIEYFV